VAVGGNKAVDFGGFGYKEDVSFDEPPVRKFIAIDNDLSIEQKHEVMALWIEIERNAAFHFPVSKITIVIGGIMAT
jgi:hypothetical protein